MKTQFNVIFVLLCSAWTCSAATLATTVGPRTTMAMTTDEEPESKESSLTAEEEVVLLRSLSDENEIEPVKSEKRHQAQNHFHPHMLADPMSYYPAPVPMPYGQNPYSPCPYPQTQPMFYPMPVYSPYSPYSPFPAYNPNAFHEEKSPPRVLKGASADSTAVVSVRELLKISKLFNNNPTKVVVPADPATTAAPHKQFFIKNWIRNKVNKKTTTTTTTSEAPTETTPMVEEANIFFKI